MRNVWMGLVLVGAAGCSTQSVNFEHRSELEVNTRGVALLDEGMHGQAGMYGTTCRVNVADASIGMDDDFSSEEEQVVEGGSIFGEPAVLVLSDLGAHLVWPARAYVDVSETDYQNPGVVDGGIWNDGIVTVVDDGSVHWVVDGEVTSIVDAGVGSPLGVSVARDGTTFIGTGSGVVTVSEDGTTGTVAGAADIVVWDDSAAVLYTANAGETWLSGVEADGTVRWTTELGGTVTAVDAMGPLASAAVMIEHGGTGELLTVDGYTGEITSSLVTPSAAQEIEVSGNGDTMALVLETEVHFFAVRGAP